MKLLYALAAAASLTLLVPTAHATIPGTDDPTEMARKATAREKVTKATKSVKKSSSHRFHKFTTSLNRNMMVLLGLKESKAVTSPTKLNRQLHILQKHLKTKARIEARARRQRTTRLLS